MKYLVYFASADIYVRCQMYQIRAKGKFPFGTIKKKHLFCYT